MSVECFDLKSKTILVTGGTGWIGTTLCTAFASAGASVIVSSTNMERACAIRDSLPKVCEGQHHDAVVLDIKMNENDLTTTFDNILADHKAIDVLVNNAYVFPSKDWKSISLAEFNEHQHNIGFIFILSRLVYNNLVSQHLPGSIINIGSMYGHVSSYPDVYEADDVPIASSVAYHASKGALINMTRHLATYWAKKGVRVNSISPGAFPKPTVAQTFRERLEKRIPLGKCGHPDSLCGIALLLASGAGAYITGQDHLVDGGWTAQ